ncbi:MAG TPA: GNAT family N-acetyltransferase [Acidimicrobiales bacterium]|nr:GNAT family N-acetyltransferase [Acidimicrobiales bacterium]
MAKMRLGVALVMPPPLDREVDTLRRATGDGTFGRVPPHCTIVPPVNVRADRLGDALAVLRAAAAASRPIEARLGPPTTFLPDTPVLYLPLEKGAAAVAALRQRVFQEPLARPLTWPFVPHVTVADEADPRRIAAAQVALCDYRADVTFDRVHLLQEGPGRVWAPIADFQLQAPAVVGRGGVEIELAVSEALDPEARTFAEREWEACNFAELGKARGAEPLSITARSGGTVVGMAEGEWSPPTAYLDNLIVAAPERGHGIGSRLLAAFESAAAERGCARLLLRVRSGSGAEGFYRHRGWVEETRLSPWYGDRDAVWLRRDL